MQGAVDKLSPKRCVIERTRRIAEGVRNALTKYSAVVQRHADLARSGLRYLLAELETGFGGNRQQQRFGHSLRRKAAERHFLVAQCHRQCKWQAEFGIDDGLWPPLLGLGFAQHALQRAAEDP